MKAILKTPQKRTAQMKKVIIKQFPDLENLEVTPSTEEQVFKSSKYGYGEVKVKKIESEELTIVPSANEQVKEGLFDKVIVLTDENLKSENILSGKTIFGVEGSLEADPELIASFTSLVDGSLGANFIKFPEGITEIGDFACYKRKNLTSAMLPEGLISIGESAFEDTNLNEIKIPSSVTNIKKRCFYNCNAHSFNIPSGITRIEEECFSMNFNIVTFTIPENVTELAYFCFYYCINMEECIIKSKTLTIERNSFYFCKKLSKLVFENLTNVPVMNETSALSYTPIAGYQGTGYIYVPDNLVEDFKSATNWSTYADQIKPLSELEVA